ncbi:MAG TPA: valine--tRNA ligase [Sphingomicrobium sp.]|nr:valine--tRNA ligase [Sphingomicrobium sp.]
MSELPKTFDPKAIEERWYAHWESRGLFRPDRPDATPWTIVMPPPNVTGSLHIGHALDNTLQDVLTRHERMLGKDALWVVGTDHAGIATQMVVERNLDSQGIKRAEIGREAFLEHVWEWKAQSGGAITRQLRRLGASCDWAHERFTMDPGFQRAVTHAFVELHKRGLVYRDKRLVNWDPKFQTAISDLEVETKDVQGKFWTLSYPLADDSGAIQVATTRPETMLADMAVAVHPEDERYKALIGKQIKHPITGRLIPIVPDEHADPELGSGAVKITPGHDFNDYEVGIRAGFVPSHNERWGRTAPIILNMFDREARVVQTQDGLIPSELLGLTREEARKAVVTKLEDEGALVRVEDRVIPTPFGDRSGVVIEPWLTEQWYVDAAKLALPALQAVKNGDIRVVPETWKKTWYNWLENIQPWCVSRQLWWGHRIPAWYAEDGHVFVAATEEEARAQAGGKPVRQDEDVLDTWFSSSLWPFATLGWPEESSSPLVGEDRGGGRGASAAQKTHSAADAAEPPPQPSPQGGGRKSELARHYPNDVLISGFDILFFWDARMAMQGIEFMGQAPWKTLYLHGLVRDAQGQKMSKSKGNTVDPLGLIDKYGADALRFTLAAMESQGRDIKLDEKRVEGYRNFATKLWNAARFLQMNGVGSSESIAAPPAELPVNRWIIGEVVETLAKLDRAFDELRYDEMADAIYHFVWGTFCDWYVELVKGAFDEETKRVAAWAFDQILVMLHPLMPFITEELWHAMGQRPYDLIVAKWPEPEAQVDPHAKREMEWLIDLVSEVRSARTELNVPPSAKPMMEVYFQSKAVEGYLLRNEKAVGRLARVGLLYPEVGRADPTWDRVQTKRAKSGAILMELEGFGANVSLEGLIDIEAEKSRLDKAAAAAEKERDSLAQRLANPNFTERAKPEAVEKARSDHEAKAAEAERLRAALGRLG